MAQVVVKNLLEEIFPRFGLPKVLGSDNGPAFVSQAHLQALQLVQQEIWKPISAAYRADNPVPCPHPFKNGDTVLVR